MGNFQGGGNRGGGFRGGNGGGRSSFRGGGRDDREVTMHKTVCSKCHKDCEVPFRPSSDYSFLISAIDKLTQPKIEAVKIPSLKSVIKKATKTKTPGVKKVTKKKK